MNKSCMWLPPNDWTPGRLSARDQITKLFTRDGYADRVIASALSSEMKRLFVEYYEVSPAGGSQCIRRLAGKRCLYKQCCLPPGGDHCELWNRHGKPFVFTSQPYGLSLNSKTAVGSFPEWLKLNDMVALVTSDSWYFYGRTQLVTIFWRPTYKAFLRNWKPGQA